MERYSISLTLKVSLTTIRKEEFEKYEDACDTFTDLCNFYTQMQSNAYLTLADTVDNVVIIRADMSNGKIICNNSDFRDGLVITIAPEARDDMGSWDLNEIQNYLSSIKYAPLRGHWQIIVFVDDKVSQERDYFEIIDTNTGEIRMFNAIGQEGEFRGSLKNDLDLYYWSYYETNE